MTTFPVSTIPAFTAALKAALEKRPALASVKVCDGPAAVGDLARTELIELMDVNDQVTVPAFDVTTQPRDESNTLTVLITVLRAGRTAQTAANVRAFVIAGELDQVLRDRSIITGAYSAVSGPGGIYGARIVSIRHTKRMGTLDKSLYREAGVEVGVHWNGRI